MMIVGSVKKFKMLFNKTRLFEIIEETTITVLLERCLATSGNNAATQIADVAQLQQVLAYRGLIDASTGEPLETCTPDLRQAIRDFQSVYWDAHPYSCRRGPKDCDGVVGSETEANLLDINLEASPPPEEGVPAFAISQGPFDDREMLARVIILEAGDVGPGAEWAAIAHVALNRAKGGDIASVVANTSWPGGGSRGRRFVRRIKGEEALSNGRHISEHPRYAAAISMAENILSGRVINPIGSRKSFVHPQGMPKTGESDGTRVSKRRIAVNGRKLPTWITPIEHGGTAREIKKVGRAIFA